MQASQQLTDQQQRQFVEQQLQLRNTEESKKLDIELQKIREELAEANRQCQQAIQNSRLADLKANNYAIGAIYQAFSDLEKTLDLLNQMEGQLRREISEDTEPQAIVEQLPSTAKSTNLKKNYF